MKSRSTGEKVFNIFNVSFLILFCVTTLYPFLNILAISLNDGMDASLGGITIFPRKFTFFNYKLVFQSDDILRTLLFSAAMTVTRTVLALLVTSAAAYVLTKKDLIFKKGLTTFFLIPMYIGGGLIPYYIIVKSLGLMNNFLVYVFPYLFDFFFALIMRVYFQTNINESIYESAYLDGANDIYIFFKIVLPLSKPMLAAVALFIGVGAWNDWYTTMLFCTNSSKLWTLQFLLQKLVMQIDAATQLAKRVLHSTGSVSGESLITPQTITYATLMVATIPIMLVYPFLQKYFVSGMMIGSVKG